MKDIIFVGKGCCLECEMENCNIRIGKANFLTFYQLSIPTNISALIGFYLS